MREYQPEKALSHCNKPTGHLLSAHRPEPIHSRMFYWRLGQLTHVSPPKGRTSQSHDDDGNKSAHAVKRAIYGSSNGYLQAVPRNSTHACAFRREPAVPSIFPTETSTAVPRRHGLASLWLLGSKIAATGSQWPRYYRANAAMQKGCISRFRIHVVYFYNPSTSNLLSCSHRLLIVSSVRRDATQRQQSLVNY